MHGQVVRAAIVSVDLAPITTRMATKRRDKVDRRDLRNRASRDGYAPEWNAQDAEACALSAVRTCHLVQPSRYHTRVPLYPVSISTGPPTS